MIPNRVIYGLDKYTTKKICTPFRGQVHLNGMICFLLEINIALAEHMPLASSLLR